MDDFLARRFSKFTLEEVEHLKRLIIIDKKRKSLNIYYLINTRGGGGRR